MITGKVIYGILSVDTAVKALVSTRIYPLVAAQDTAVPFITFRTVQRRPSNTKINPSYLDVYEVEINIYSNSYTNACAISDAVRAALDYKKGTVNGVVLQHSVYESGNEGYIHDGNYYHIQDNYSLRIQR